MSIQTISPGTTSGPAALPGGVPFRLAWLLARSGSGSSRASALPVVAFGLVTAILLTVVAGAVSFMRWDDADGGLYQILAAIAAALLVVPLLTLGGSAARLSARRRDDRLATLRLLGATPSTVTIMTVVESMALALTGVVAGVVGYLLLAPLVSLLHFRGEPIGGAIWLHPLLVLAISVAVVLLSAISSALGLRRVIISPLGVRTRQTTGTAHWIRAVAGVGLILAVCAAMASLQIFQSAAIIVAVMVMGFAGALAVLNFMGPWVIGVAGRRQVSKAPTPGRLIAARSILESPKASWRQVSGVSMSSFIAVFAGAAAALANTVESEPGSPDAYLAADIQTGVLITIITSFIMVACSAGVNQAAEVLDRDELYSNLHQLGVPEPTLNQARVRTVMLPLLVIALGSAAAATIVILPIAGLALILAPISVLVIIACVAAGIGSVWVALQASRPMLRRAMAS